MACFLLIISNYLTSPFTFSHFHYPPFLPFFPSLILMDLLVKIYLLHHLILQKICQIPHLLHIHINVYIYEFIYNLPLRQTILPLDIHSKPSVFVQENNKLYSPLIPFLVFILLKKSRCSILYIKCNTSLSVLVSLGFKSIQAIFY